MKIEKLTAAQQRRLTEFRDKWIAIGLSTQPADRPRAEEAIREMYRSANLPTPRKIVWCSSPLSQGLTRALILLFSNEDPTNASVRASVWASIWASVQASVWASVRDSVGASVWASVRDSVGASVWASVGASVGDSVWASVRDSVWASVGASGCGQHDASWLAFYEYMREVLGLKTQTQKLVGHMEQAKSAGWYLPCKNICWVVERPNVLKRDERGRLHNLTGPALQYPDGWSIYNVHGVLVPHDIIENRSTITVQRIEKETNAEVRRVMIELFGFDRYLKEGGFALEQQDDFGRLYRKRVSNEPDLVFVRVVNSTMESDGTYKEYVLPVRSTVTTAHEAVASTFGLTTEEYQPFLQS